MRAIRDIPDFIKHRSHHPLLCLAYSDIQSLRLTLALCQCGLAADGAVGVHVFGRRGWSGGITAVVPWFEADSAVGVFY
jgi:hypothetical protein